jgi:hypothetical protein
MPNDDDNIGYKRPPRRSQFKPGQSGNPSGKRSGSRNISTELADILSEEMSFAENGTLKTMTKQRALASALVSAAVGGDLRATAIVLSHLLKDGRNIEEANVEDTEVFDAVRAHRRKGRREA